MMKICAAQTRPFKGDIPKNIENHKKLIKIAIANKADIIVFPELSLTGYEPELAEELSMSQKEDCRLNDFQVISDENNIMLCVGIPTRSDIGVCISMIIFQPNLGRQIYSKQFLHPGEEKYFVSGQNVLPIEQGNNKIAFAICYETSILEHSEAAHKNGADIYFASVLNSVGGVDKDIERISRISRKYAMISLMSNFTGKSGEYDCAGKSSIWNGQGILVGQLSMDEGIIMIDTENQEVIEKYV